MKKLLNRRTVPALLLCALALSAGDRLLFAVWPDYELARRIAMAAGSLLALAAALLAAFGLGERKRRDKFAAKETEAASEPPEELVFTDGHGVFPSAGKVKKTRRKKLSASFYPRLIQTARPGTDGVSKKRAILSRWVSFHLSKPAAAIWGP